MSKLISSIIAVLLLVTSVNPDRERFAKYKSVEAYEVRPGLLMLPKYSADGQVCEIGIERLHYSPEMIRLDSGLTREEIDLAFDELVPTDERGPQGPEGDLFFVNGGSGTEVIGFENVSLQIDYKVLSVSKRQQTVEPDVVAIIQWKHRKCQ